MMYDISECRERDGDAADDRSDRVEELVNGDRLGYGDGDPLVGDSDDYSSYPEQPADLTTPDARSFVTELFEHEKVNSIRDAIDETTGATSDPLIVRDWRQAFEHASELFGVELPDGDDETGQRATDDRLAELLGDYPDDMVTPSNPLVVARLYGGYGLSTEEIAEVFRDDDCNVKSNQVRRVLRSAGLVHGPSKPDGKDVSEILVNYDSGNSGVNVDTNAVATDPHVSVQRDEQSDD